MTPARGSISALTSRSRSWSRRKSLLDEMGAVRRFRVGSSRSGSSRPASAGDRLGVQGLGRVEAGAPADILLFRRDPTKAIGNLQALRPSYRGQIFRVGDRVARFDRARRISFALDKTACATAPSARSRRLGARSGPAAPVLFSGNRLFGVEGSAVGNPAAFIALAAGSSAPFSHFNFASIPRVTGSPSGPPKSSGQTPFGTTSAVTP